MGSTVQYDSAVIVPATQTASNDTSATGVDALCMRGYAGFSLHNRVVTGNSSNLWFWQQIGASAGSGAIIDSANNNAGGFDFYFGHGAVLSSTGPVFFVPYLATKTGVAWLCAAVLSGQTLVGNNTSGSGAIDTNAAQLSTLTCAGVSTATGYIAYSNATDGVVLIKSTNLDAATPTWSARKVIQASGSVVRGSLAAIAGNLYVMVLNGGTITAYKSTNDGTSWTSLGTVVSSVSASGGPGAASTQPIACMKNASFWCVAYYKAAVGLRFAFTRDGGSTWTDTLVSAATPSSMDVFGVHASHFLVGWTGDSQSSGTSLPTYAESIDGGATWTTPTVIAGGGGAPSSANHNFALSKITHGVPATGGTDGGILDGSGVGTLSSEWMEFALFTNQPTGSPSEPVYIETGGWFIPEKTNDPDTVTSSTLAEGAGLSFRATVAANNGEGAALHFRATVAANNGEGAALHFRATVAANNGEGPSHTFTAAVGADTTRYPAETGLGALISRPRGSIFGSTWWQRTPEMPPHAVALFPATWRQEADFVGHVQRAMRDGGPLPVGDLGLMITLLRKAAPNVGHVQHAIRDEAPLPRGDLGLAVIFARSRRTPLIGHTSFLIEVPKKDSGGGYARALASLRARQQRDEEEAFLLLVLAALSK